MGRKRHTRVPSECEETRETSIYSGTLSKTGHINSYLLHSEDPTTYINSNLLEGHNRRRTYYYLFRFTIVRCVVRTQKVKKVNNRIAGHRNWEVVEGRGCLHDSVTITHFVVWRKRSDVVGKFNDTHDNEGKILLEGEEQNQTQRHFLMVSDPLKISFL